MNKSYPFLFLLIAGIIGILLFPFFLAPFHLINPSMRGVMERMMGSSYETIALNPLMLELSLGFLALLIIGIFGLVYFMILPEIPSHSEPLKSEKTYGVVLNILTKEERKVVELLLAHNGVYLQKYIAKEAELSRLKTHRIIKRLADRGIVTAQSKGNTREIKLAEWFKPSPD